MVDRMHALQLSSWGVLVLLRHIHGGPHERLTDTKPLQTQLQNQFC